MRDPSLPMAHIQRAVGMRVDWPLSSSVTTASRAHRVEATVKLPLSYTAKTTAKSKSRVSEMRAINLSETFFEMFKANRL